MSEQDEYPANYLAGRVGASAFDIKFDLLEWARAMSTRRDEKLNATPRVEEWKSDQ